MEIMAFVMVVSRWPLSSTDEVGKVTLEVLKKPALEYVKRREMFGAADSEDGIKSYVLLEIEDEHLNDGLKRLTEDFMEFRVVPGYTYSIETLIGAEDAFALMGLKL
jgi:hypothetical protein